MQKPLGPADSYCPMWRKAMSKVCHTCPWWKPVRFTDPQTGSDVDRWDCAIAWLPGLEMLTAQKVNQAGAATESFRNDLIKRIDPNGYAIEADQPKMLPSDV